jgi:hypothetical protein
VSDLVELLLEDFVRVLDEVGSAQDDDGQRKDDAAGEQRVGVGEAVAVERGEREKASV